MMETQHTRNEVKWKGVLYNSQARQKGAPRNAQKIVDGETAACGRAWAERGTARRSRPVTLVISLVGLVQSQEPHLIDAWVSSSVQQKY